MGIAISVVAHIFALWVTFKAYERGWIDNFVTTTVKLVYDVWITLVEWFAAVKDKMIKAVLKIIKYFRED